MFKITKSIAAILVAIMMLSQIGMAQHATVHFTDHGHYEHLHDDHGHDDHGDHNDHNRSERENCQICVITKSLVVGLNGENIDFRAPAFLGRVFDQRHDPISDYQYKFSYNSRAPPIFLI